jgi:hypothetical protein
MRRDEMRVLRQETVVTGWLRFTWLVVGVVALAEGSAQARIYPVNKCVSRKQREAGRYCKRILGVWAKWDTRRDDAQRDEKFQDAFNNLDLGWDKAEVRSSGKGTDCVDATLSSANMASLIDTAIAEIVTDINNGLDLSSRGDARCGQKLLKAAARKCVRLLKAESRYIKRLDKDPDGTARDARKLGASQKFRNDWSSATAGSCPTTATEGGIESLIDGVTADVVTNVTVSPNVPADVFMAIPHPAGGQPGNEVVYEGETLVPQCQDSTAYTFFAKRGSENKLLAYFQGGGACWDTFTCSSPVPLCFQDTNPNKLVGRDEFGGGFGALTNPDNPFKNWHVVFLPYCSCDVHWGHAAVDYPQASIFPEKHVEHRGYDNAKLVEKWVREHFVNPTDIFVTGLSAGSYGAMLGGVFLNEVYPASNISVLGFGGNGVSVQEFLEQNLGNWGVEEHLPDVPGIRDVPVTEQSMTSILAAAASFYPQTNWGNYTTAFDGGQWGQTGFYHVMLNPANVPEDMLAWLNWWESSCQFNEMMLQQAFDMENDNYRYYIGSGSLHVSFYNDRVYTDTTGGVPPLVDWVNAMIDGTSGWMNVEASPFNVLLPGDPAPTPLQPPFEQDGDDIIIMCPPPSPSAAFLDVTTSVLD